MGPDGSPLQSSLNHELIFLINIIWLEKFPMTDIERIHKQGSNEEAGNFGLVS